MDGVRHLLGSTLVILLAGCFDSGGVSDDAGSARGDEPLMGGGGSPPIVAPGCDAKRPAFAHHEDAVPAVVSGMRPIPCLSKTGVNSREPTIGISATGTVFHYPAMTGDNARPSGVARSRDEGATWELILPSLAGQPTHVVSTDPYFYLDPTTGRIFADDLNVPNCSMFSWSDDEGATWDHSLSGCLETDHQNIFAGAPVTSTTIGYPNIVYRCAINAVALGDLSTMTTCQRSLDGGRTWLPPGPPAYVTPEDRLPEVCTGAVGHGTTDAEGTIYLPKGVCDEPWLAISADEGITWRRMRTSELTSSGHDTGVGVDPAGNIFYFFIDGEENLPYLTYSTDDGATWSDPRMVGSPGVAQTEHPELIVGGVGKLAFVYYGTENNGTSFNAYIGMTVDALSEDPIFYSASVNDPEEDPFVMGNCCGGLQDFMDVRIGPDGTPWGAFIDDCLGEGMGCVVVDEVLDTHRVGVAGRLWGGPSLWSDEDPNGPYP